jgi:hypothetical protein
MTVTFAAALVARGKGPGGAARIETLGRRSCSHLWRPPVPPSPYPKTKDQESPFHYPGRGGSLGSSFAEGLCLEGVFDCKPEESIEEPVPSSRVGAFHILILVFSRKGARICRKSRYTRISRS